MSRALLQLMPSIVRRLETATGLPVAASDAHGRVIAASAPPSAFCPLIVREEDVAAPLPSRCEGCPRVARFLALAGGLAGCPRGADVVRAIRLGGRTAGWLSTRIEPGGVAAATMARAEEIFELTALLVSAVLALEAREELARSVLSRSVTAARGLVAGSLPRAAVAGDTGGPTAADVDLVRRAKGELDRACDALAAFRDAPSPVLESVDAADGATPSPGLVRPSRLDADRSGSSRDARARPPRAGR